MVLIVALCGCASTQSVQLPFPDAVRQAIREHGGQKCVAIDLDADGTFCLAGRPTTLSELPHLASVSGIPYPVIVLIDVHRVANHEAIRNVTEVCKAHGVEMVIVKGILKGSDPRNVQSY